MYLNLIYDFLSGERVQGLKVAVPPLELELDFSPEFKAVASATFDMCPETEKRIKEIGLNRVGKNGI